MTIYVIHRIGKRAAVDLMMVALDAAHHTAGYIDYNGPYEWDPFNVFSERFDDQAEAGWTVETVEPLMEDDCVIYRVDGSQKPDQTFHHFCDHFKFFKK